MSTWSYPLGRRDYIVCCLRTYWTLQTLVKSESQQQQQKTPQMYAIFYNENFNRNTYSSQMRSLIWAISTYNVRRTSYTGEDDNDAWIWMNEMIFFFLAPDKIESLMSDDWCSGWYAKQEYLGDMIFRIHIFSSWKVTEHHLNQLTNLPEPCWRISNLPLAHVAGNPYGNQVHRMYHDRLRRCLPISETIRRSNQKKQLYERNSKMFN